MVPFSPSNVNQSLDHISLLQTMVNGLPLR